MNWLSRLKGGLAKSSAKLGGGIAGLFKGGRKLDAAAIGDLEEVLIRSDLGPATAARLAGALAKRRFEREVSDGEIRTALAEEIAAILAQVARPFALDPSRKPHVILVVGVNGSGKTTTIGKLAQQLRAAGKRVTLAAGDTFRAAAIEQLEIWGERTGSPVVAKRPGSDPAGLAYEALEQARARGDDALLIDTAGRLQNKKELMEELAKINRVIKKLDPAAPHSVLLVLDANIGQNAHAQVEAFRAMSQVTGLVVTKLDGTARGGVVVALAERFGLPVHAVGVGEGVDDLHPFDPSDFARGLVGLN
jgi:fused signal recognition particle receptor